VLIQLYAVAVAVAGAVAAFVAVVIWMWPEPDRECPSSARTAPDQVLPVERGQHRAWAWTALWVTLGADTALFASLVFSFFFL
jgi:cytochrome c oxidase subunit I+III